MGGELQGIFGIMSNRQKQHNQLNIYNPINILYESNQENKKYWITEIPDKYKPPDYMKIEKVVIGKNFSKFNFHKKILIKHQLISLY